MRCTEAVSGNRKITERNLDIRWKQQHINNACVPACLAMLLSQYKIEKEDSEIIYESKMPYLVEYNEEFKAFGAGVLMQNEEVLPDYHRD